jgi:hypothetical protein
LEFDHKYWLKVVVTLRTTLPLQNSVAPDAVIVGVTPDPYTTVLVADPEQPLLLVTVRVYVAAVDTVMDCVVAPVDHRYDE